MEGVREGYIKTRVIEAKVDSSRSSLRSEILPHLKTIASRGVLFRGVLFRGDPYTPAFLLSPRPLYAGAANDIAQFSNSIVNFYRRYLIDASSNGLSKIL